MQQSFENIQKAGKDHLDLVVKSMTAMSKGAQAIAAEMVDFSKKSYEDGAATFEKLAGVKSLDKVFEVQSEAARHAYEAAVARFTKIGEMLTEMAKETYKPYEGVMSQMAQNAQNAQANLTHPTTTPPTGAKKVA